MNLWQFLMRYYPEKAEELRSFKERLSRIEVVYRPLDKPVELVRLDFAKELIRNKLIPKRKLGRILWETPQRAAKIFKLNLEKNKLVIYSPEIFRRSVMNKLLSIITTRLV
jgi:hypothetical protein